MAMNLNPLLNLINGLKSLDVEAEVVKIVEDNKPRITELMQEQLSAGKDIDGDKRVDGYRPLTIYLKKKYGIGLGAETNRVTFFMEGNLYNSLFTQVRGKKYNIFSPLPTYTKMLDRIGDKQFGVDPDQRLEFAKTVTLPEFGKVLKQKTGLTI